MTNDIRYFKLASMLILLVITVLVWVTPVEAAKSDSNQVQTKEKMTQDSSDNKPDNNNWVKHVYFIVVPDLTMEAVNHFHFPRLTELAQGGIYSEGVLTRFPDNLDTNLATLLTGYEPEQHKHLKTKDQLAKKNIFKLMEETDRKSIVVDGTGRLKPLSQGAKLVLSDASLAENGGAQEIMDLFLAEDKKAEPFLSMLVFPKLEAEESNNKNNQLIKVDRQIGRLVDKLHEEGAFNQSLIVVVGLDSPNQDLGVEKLLNPIILKGPKLKAGIKVPTFNLADITPTLQYVIDSEVPQGDGYVVWNLLKPENEFTETNLLQKRVNELSGLLEEQGYQRYQLHKEINSFYTEKMRIDDQQKAAQKAVAEKQNYIDRLELKLRIAKYGGLALGMVLAFGYLVEYLILRKKFLMF